METCLDKDVEKTALDFPESEAERVFHGHEKAGYAALCTEGQRTRILYFSPDWAGYVGAIEAITRNKEKMGRILYNPKLKQAA